MSAPRATSLLTWSYFRVFPGMGRLFAVGLACLAGGCLATLPAQRTAWLAAAGCFMVAVPALFAGAHFRQLASRRSHLLLPTFAGRMIAAVIALFAVLALLSAGLLWLHSGQPPGQAWVLASLAWSALFWFGFLPTALRALIGLLLIALLLRLQPGLPAAAAGMLALPLSLALVVSGWAAFAVWIHRRVLAMHPFERSDRATWELPLSLNWNLGPAIGSPVGTLLLGLSDAPSACWLRALIGVLLVPGLLFLLLQLALGTDGAKVWIGDPVLSFLTLAYALGHYTHLCQSAARRQPLLWLRVGADWPGLRRLAERVLLAEWLPLAVALGLLNLGICWLGAWKAVLLPFSLCWLAALLFNLQLALQSQLRERSQLLAISAQLLGLAGCVALVRIGESLTILWALLAVQGIAIARLRRLGIARSG